MSHFFGHISPKLRRVVDLGAETVGITVSRHAEFKFGGFGHKYGSYKSFSVEKSQILYDFVAKFL